MILKRENVMVPCIQVEEDRREPGAGTEEPGLHGGEVRGGLQEGQQAHSIRKLFRTKSRKRLLIFAALCGPRTLSLSLSFLSLA